VLNDHDRGKRAFALGNAYIELHILAADLDALPECCHGSALLT
jgi:hypothetical protein